MRRSEILNLKWEDISLEERYLTVGDSKNGESRTIPINDLLADTLIKLKETSYSDYVFAHNNGAPFKTLKYGFWSALKKSGIKHCRFHDLRHTFASNLVMAGVDI